MVRKIRDRLQKTNPEFKTPTAARGKAPVLRAASQPGGGQQPQSELRAQIKGRRNQSHPNNTRKRAICK